MTIADTDRCRKPSPRLPKSKPKPQTLNPRSPPSPNKSTKYKVQHLQVDSGFIYRQQYVHLKTHTKYRSFLTLPKTYILIATKDQLIIKSSEPQLAPTPSALYNPKP